LEEFGHVDRRDILHLLLDGTVKELVEEFFLVHKAQGVPSCQPWLLPRDYYIERGFPVMVACWAGSSPKARGMVDRMTKGWMNKKGAIIQA
jgi:hypothetical protein